MEKITKQKIGIAIGTVVFCLVFITNIMVFVQKDNKTIDFSFLPVKAYAQNNGLGCYTTLLIDCPAPVLFGQWKDCQFTGAYGAPYYCKPTSCSTLSNPDERHCVKSTE
jgi:hypothetical protein